MGERATGGGRAGQQALKQLHTQMADLTAAVKQNTYMYGPEQMVELLTSLGRGHRYIG